MLSTIFSHLATSSRTCPCHNINSSINSSWLLLIKVRTTLSINIQFLQVMILMRLKI